MRFQTTLMTMLTVLTLTAASATAGANPAMMPPLPSQAAPQFALPTTHALPHASLRLDVGRTKGWVGQSIPITLRAYFHGDEGVTIEGAPQLASSGIFTSELAKEPRQSTELVNGEPVLVATWTGTVTPSTAEPLTITAEMPVHVRYRDAATQVSNADPFRSGLFDALQGNMMDPSAFDHFFDESMRESVGRLHEEASTLHASTHAIEISALPSKDQPASFSGAIGHFDLNASLASTTARVSEPITLRVVVDGAGDLDRVELPGVAGSADWKTYPSKSTMEPASKNAPARKTFEQILIPLRGGDLSVPAVSLAAFDPNSGTYVSKSTLPIPIHVDGTAIADPPQILDPIASTPMAATPPVNAPLVVPRLPSLTKIMMAMVPVAALLFAAVLVFAFRRKRSLRALKQTMKRAAARGDVPPFYRAAHTLIETRLAARWAIDPEEINPSLIRERLGPAGDPLADAVWADDVLRFGRGRLENVDLIALSSSIEQSLGGAS